jgi:RNA polymerase sigma-70 factor (ECF subfamily)
VEEEYLKNIVSLDSSHIETLVRRYWHDVWQYAFFLTRREHLADDITQDTFIRAFRAIETFRGQCPVKNWLLKIARNTAFNYKKSAFIKKVALIGFIADTRSIPSAESEFFSDALTDRLWETVLGLPQKYREILILHGHYGLTHAELGDLLGITEGTVKSGLSRARSKLLKKLKEEDAND